MDGSEGPSGPFKKYFVLTAQQIERLRGTDVKGDRLEQERSERLREAAKDPQSTSKYLHLKDAVRRHVTHTTKAQNEPLIVPIGSQPAAENEWEDFRVKKGVGATARRRNRVLKKRSRPIQRKKKEKKKKKRKVTQRWDDDEEEEEEEEEEEKKGRKSARPRHRQTQTSPTTPPKTTKKKKMMMTGRGDNSKTKPAAAAAARRWLTYGAMTSF